MIVYKPNCQLFVSRSSEGDTYSLHTTTWFKKTGFHPEDATMATVSFNLEAQRYEVVLKLKPMTAFSIDVHSPVVHAVQLEGLTFSESEVLHVTVEDSKGKPVGRATVHLSDSEEDGKPII